MSAGNISLAPLGRGRGPLSSDNGRVRGRFKRHLNGLKHTIHIAQNVVVPETQHPVAFAFKKSRARHILCAVGMLPAIRLDNQLAFGTEKISDIRTNRHLTAKLETTKAAIAQAQPQRRFRFGLMTAQMPRPRNIQALHMLPPSPNPLPEGERAKSCHTHPTHSLAPLGRGQNHTLNSLAPTEPLAPLGRGRGPLSSDNGRVRGSSPQALTHHFSARFVKLMEERKNYGGRS